jgi:hypothetical protein
MWPQMIGAPPPTAIGTAPAFSRMYSAGTLTPETIAARYEKRAARSGI